jgi:hypothetical protein
MVDPWWTHGGPMVDPCWTHGDPRVDSKEVPRCLKVYQVNLVLQIAKCESVSESVSDHMGPRAAYAAKNKKIVH